MIEFRLSPDSLGRAKFARSPIAEVATSLRAAAAPLDGPIVHPYLREAGRQLSTGDLHLLRAIVPQGSCVPDFMFAWSVDPRTTIADQLTDLLELPDEELARDIRAVWRDRPMPEPARRTITTGRAGREALVQAISNYWDIAIAPQWTRMRAVIDDDISYRATRVLAGGLYDLLTDLHSEVTLHSSVLCVDKPHLPNAAYLEAELTLVPSVFAWPQLVVAQARPGQFELVYPARGIGRTRSVTSADETADPLGALLGRTRAAILRRLVIPMSTTHLAAELGQSPGTVSEHLAILRRSGLVTSWRSGRNVMYRITPLASSVVEVSSLGTDVPQQSS